MTPNNVFGHAHNPERHTGIPAIDELPPAPYFLSGGWAHFIGVVAGATAKSILVAVIMLARIKRIIRVVLQNIGFERPVLGGSQTALDSLRKIADFSFE